MNDHNEVSVAMKAESLSLAAAFIFLLVVSMKRNSDDNSEEVAAAVGRRHVPFTAFPSWVQLCYQTKGG